MIQVKVISRVEIPVITEEVMQGLIVNEIKKDNPDLVINSVKFERKLNPQRIEATVDAQIGGTPSTPTETTEPVVEPQTEDDVEPTSVTGIFDSPTA